MKTPIVGSQLWYWPSREDALSPSFMKIMKGQPVAAIATGIFEGNCHVIVFDCEGYQAVRHHVPLVAPTGPTIPERSLTWPIETVAVDMTPAADQTDDYAGVDFGNTEAYKDMLAINVGKAGAERMTSSDFQTDGKEAKPSYHDLHITTSKIARKSIFDLPFSLQLICTRTAGWELCENGDVVAGEYADDGKGLRLDVAGYVILDSLGQASPAPKLVPEVAEGRLLPLDSVGLYLDELKVGLSHDERDAAQSITKQYYAQRKAGIDAIWLHLQTLVVS